MHLNVSHVSRSRPRKISMPTAACCAVETINWSYFIIVDCIARNANKMSSPCYSHNDYNNNNNIIERWTERCKGAKTKTKTEREWKQNLSIAARTPRSISLLFVYCNRLSQTSAHMLCSIPSRCACVCLCASCACHGQIQLHLSPGTRQVSVEFLHQTTDVHCAETACSFF